MALLEALTWRKPMEGEERDETPDDRRDLRSLDIPRERNGLRNAA
jgi:hypothetical protein